MSPASDPPRRRAIGQSCALPAGIGQCVRMIFGTHVVIYSNDADADRAFLADVLGFEYVDAGGGWLIFGVPPAEVAIHPAKAPASELYFMCDDLAAEMRTLAEKGVQFSEVAEPRWGSVTKIRLPGGGEVGLYQPRHPAMVERS
jgi:catechol 2,3-dioxygenase-like lactoylglutathione lyase family enzyme